MQKHNMNNHASCITAWFSSFSVVTGIIITDLFGFVNDIFPIISDLLRRVIFLSHVRRGLL